MSSQFIPSNKPKFLSISENLEEAHQMYAQLEDKNKEYDLKLKIIKKQGAIISRALGILNLCELDLRASILSQVIKNIENNSITKGKEKGYLSAQNTILNKECIIDALTQIPNRKYLEEGMEYIWRSHQRLNQESSLITPEISFIMIDIDNFRKFNNDHGHDVGDQCLRKVAEVLADTLTRSGDFVARYGGEEFTVVLPHTNKDGASIVAEKLRKAVENIEFKKDGKNLPITISLGIASCIPSKENSCENLKVLADKALYKAKNNGKNQVSTDTSSISFNKNIAKSLEKQYQEIKIQIVKLKESTSGKDETFWKLYNQIKEQAKEAIRKKLLPPLSSEKNFQDLKIRLSTAIEAYLDIRIDWKIAKVTNKIIKEQTFFDALTGVHNRRYLDKQAEQIWSESKRVQTIQSNESKKNNTEILEKQGEIACIMIDIDHFKSFNDNYGHSVGDRCLNEVAQTLKNNLPRSGDVLARYGGEEFTVVLPNTNIAGATTVAERLRTAVENLRFMHQRTHIPVTISLGVATLMPSGKNSFTDLQTQADTLLYQAKKNGRNQVAALAQKEVTPPRFAFAN